MVEEEKLETPERFICVQLKGSEKVTVIDVCAFLKKANNKNAKTKYEYADALLARGASMQFLNSCSKPNH